MADTAARWVGRLLPEVPWRQWVLTSHLPNGGLVPRRRVPWAQLLRRVFLLDVLHCSGCGGRRRILAEVTDPLAARRILEHLGLDPETPGPVPARGPPTLDIDWAS